MTPFLSKFEATASKYPFAFIKCAFIKCAVRWWCSPQPTAPIVTSLRKPFNPWAPSSSLWRWDKICSKKSNQISKWNKFFFYLLKQTSSKVNKLGVDGAMMRNTLKSVTGERTVPAIFICGEPVRLFCSFFAPVLLYWNFHVRPHQYPICTIFDSRLPGEGREQWVNRAGNIWPVHIHHWHHHLHHHFHHGHPHHHNLPHHLYI